MAVLKTGDLELPTQILDPWLKTVAEGSSVAALSASIPMKFGKGQAMTFDSGEAEYVGEGANKGSSDYTKKVQTTEPFKFHKTVRWTDEVMWADEDYQLGVVDQILAQIQPALSRALDFGIYHGINPIDGTRATAMATYLDQAPSITASGNPTTDLDNAAGVLLGASYTPDGVALDPRYGGMFMTARNDDQVKLYPDFRPTTALSSLDGWRASTSRTVSAAGVAADPTGTAAYFGQFSAIRWGVQRQIGLKVIEYGDPDGAGDLQRNNQIAFRAEVVYGWGIADLGAFVRVATPMTKPVITAPASGETVPPVHNVTGTGTPGAAVTLWADEKSDGSWHSTSHTTTDATSGEFAFAGDTPAKVGALSWKVVDAWGQESDPVDITVSDGAQVQSARKSSK